MKEIKKTDKQLIKEAKEFVRTAEVHDPADARRLAEKWNKDSESYTPDMIKDK